MANVPVSACTDHAIEHSHKGGHWTTSWLPVGPLQPGRDKLQTPHYQAPPPPVVLATSAPFAMASTALSNTTAVLDASQAARSAMPRSRATALAVTSCCRRPSPRPAASCAAARTTADRAWGDGRVGGSKGAGGRRARGAKSESATWLGLWRRSRRLRLRASRWCCAGVARTSCMWTRSAHRCLRPVLRAGALHRRAPRRCLLRNGAALAR